MCSKSAQNNEVVVQLVLGCNNARLRPAVIKAALYNDKGDMLILSGNCGFIGGEKEYHCTARKAQTLSPAPVTAEVIMWAVDGSGGLSEYGETQRMKCM